MTTTLRFIDTSGQQHSQGPIDWHAVKTSGIDGVYVKLSEGGVVDPYGQRDVREAHAAGLHTGVYHFARNDLGNVAANEASVFNNARRWLPTNCPPCLDTEKNPSLQWNDEFLAEVDGCIGYTYRSARDTLSLPNSKVWIAWPNGVLDDYLGVQYGTGTVPGISVPVDLDTFSISLVPTEVNLEAVIAQSIVGGKNTPDRVDDFWIHNGTVYHSWPDAAIAEPLIGENSELQSVTVVSFYFKLVGTVMRGVFVDNLGNMTLCYQDINESVWHVQGVAT